MTVSIPGYRILDGLYQSHTSTIYRTDSFLGAYRDNWKVMQETPSHIRMTLVSRRVSSLSWIGLSMEVDCRKRVARLGFQERFQPG